MNIVHNLKTHFNIIIFSPNGECWDTFSSQATAAFLHEAPNSSFCNRHITRRRASRAHASVAILGRHSSGSTWAPFIQSSESLPQPCVLHVQLHVFRISSSFFFVSLGIISFRPYSV
jgi:hypothetical protein